MDFSLNQEQRMIKDSVRKFAQEQIIPHARQWDHDGKFPREYVASTLRFGPGFSAHGSSDMPVWGPIFQYLDNYDEAAVRRRGQ